MLKENLNFSFFRLYIFLFFNCIYAFLVFWIGTTIIVFQPFAIGGIIFYFFVLFFHRGIIGITQKNQDSTKDSKDAGKISLFFIILIIFCCLYLIGVYLTQGLVIKYSGIPKTAFSIVSWSFTIVSLSLSFLISFFDKKKK